MEHELATSTVNLKVFFWVHTKDYKVAANVLKGRIINKVLATLTEAGFMLPGNITELKMYGGQDALQVQINNNDRVIDAIV